MFELEHEHGLDPYRLDNMPPWEFDIQVSLLMESLKRKNEARGKK